MIVRLHASGHTDGATPMSAPEKGLEVLIDALAKVQNPAITLHIAGAGKSSYVQQLVRRCQVAGIADRVVWHGHLDNVGRRTVAYGVEHHVQAAAVDGGR